MKKLNYGEGQEKELVTRRDKLMGEMSSLKEKIRQLESKFPQVQFEYNDPSANFDRRRVRGPVVRLMTVREREAATALEVTAGGRLYNVVVDTEETGKQLLQKGGLRRRYTIIPLNKISSHSIPDNTTRKAQSLVGGGDKVRPALSLVGYEEDLRPAMAFVFGSTFVCDTLKIAKQVTFDKEVMTRSVSLAGDVFDPAGTLTGGARASSSSILLHLDQLWSLEQQLREKEAELANVSTQLASLEQLAAKYHELKEEREEKAHEAEVVRVRLEQSSHHRQMEHLRQLKENITQLKETVKEAKVSEKKARKRLDDIQRKMKEFSSHRDAELKAAEEEMARVREEAVGVVREAKTRQQQVEALRMELEELEKSLQSQRLLMEQCSEGISKKMSTVEENQTTESETQASLQEARGRLEDEREAARERNKELQRYDAERREREKEKAGHVLAAKEVEHRVTKFQKHTREAAAKVESLLTHYEWIATDRQYFGQPNTAYDFQANDPKEASRRMEKLKEQKEKLSKTVNMRAMNMLGKAEERYNDLLKKKEIVANDKTKIVKLIEELDQKKNTTLKEAHHRVNRDFGSIFSTLLPGTEACLSPPEGQTVLDGLEVRVAFGGVWKDSLQELSGGQRSLVALSLILSLLLFKPAPVYILDEVDAALDLSHTQNIGQMLRSHFPQFPVHRGVPQRRNVQQCQRSLQDKVCRRSINCNKVREPSPSCHYS
ncbi:Structural maintenance of chromosomes protein 2 [Geodia barretti]|uniref:Structural maintenance of chromosomes protein 2 n=1 Tax=Geodia barretti TaxID=519541 RepID=A0AA35TWF4_GEOBA|nr:Structural maintenance of chromosomes protein 2 [Geodia barretti]